MRAIVTGGAGFLGSHLVDRLLTEGYQCVIVDNFITGSPDNIAHLRNDRRVQVIQTDVSRGFEVDEDVDIIFHFASPASPDDFRRLPLELMRAGSFGTHHCLEMAARKGAKFLVASTSEVYGDPLVHPQPEDYWGHVNPVGPRACYDEAKRYAEAITVVYRDYYNVDTRIVRLFNTYGPRMRLDDGRVVPNFIRQALKGEPLTVYGSGANTRSFGYFQDVIDGVVRLAHSDFKEPVNIGSQQEFTMLDFAQKVIEVTGSSSPIEFLPAAVDDPKQRHPDITRARTILGWEPTTTLAQGLALTVPYFRNKLGFPNPS